MSGEAIGMMEGAFFVSRGELINWISDVLKVFVKLRLFLCFFYN